MREKCMWNLLGREPPECKRIPQWVCSSSLWSRQKHKTTIHIKLITTLQAKRTQPFYVKNGSIVQPFAILCECAGRQTKDVLAEKMGFNGAVCGRVRCFTLILSIYDIHENGTLFTIHRYNIFSPSLCLALSTGHHLNASMYVNRKFEVNLKRRWLWAFDWLYGKYFNPLINNDYDPGFDV